MTKYKLLIAVFFCAACGGGTNVEPVNLFDQPQEVQAPATENEIVGLWTYTYHYNGIEMENRLRIAVDRVALSVRCIWPDGTVVVSSTASLAEASNDILKYLQNKKVREENKEGDKRCFANIDVSTHNVSLKGLDMSLTEQKTGRLIEAKKLSD